MCAATSLPQRRREQRWGTRRAPPARTAACEGQEPGRGGRQRERGRGSPRKPHAGAEVHSPGRRALRHLHTRGPSPRGGGWGFGQEKAPVGCSREAGLCLLLSLAWVSPCCFGEKVNATTDGSSKEPRTRQMRLKQNVPWIYESHQTASVAGHFSVQGAAASRCTDTVYLNFPTCSEEAPPSSLSYWRRKPRHRAPGG